MRTAVVLVPALLLVFNTPAAAHMVVLPKESTAGGWERYSLLVPTEKTSPTVKVELKLPAGMDVIAIEAKPGWQGKHEPLPVGAAKLRWTGGRIPPQHMVAFDFLVWNPPAARTISWELTQWYEDGTSDRWGAPADADHTSTTVLKPAPAGAQRHTHPPASGAGGEAAAGAAPSGAGTPRTR